MHASYGKVVSQALCCRSACLQRSRAASTCETGVSVFQQKGDEDEEGVTSEGRMTKKSHFGDAFQLHFSLSLHSSLFFNPLFFFIHPSLEFDKFLEERAKAAEMTPGMPSPPGGEPGAAQGTPKRKKPERPDEQLLAM